MDRSSAGRLFARVSLALLGCVLALVVAEAALRLVRVGNEWYYVWQPNLIMTVRPAPGLMPGVGPEAQIRVNAQGVRGSDWSPNRADEYRILALGGSTTECLYLDQAKTRTALIERALGPAADGRRTWAGNLGKGGANTRGHVAFMRLAIDQYDVDAIVLLDGGNDMINRLMQDDAYDPYFIDDEARYREWLRSRFAVVPSSHRSHEMAFFKRTALWGVARQASQAYRGAAETTPQVAVQDEHGAWLAPVRQSRHRAALVDELPALDSALDEYERNIVAIVQHAQRRSIRIVLVTQPTIWRETMSEQEHSLLWWGWRPDERYYTTGALVRAMESYNQRLLAVCRALNVECLGAASRLPRTLDVFYDDVHFTELGAQLLADELTAFSEQETRTCAQRTCRHASASRGPLMSA